MLHGSALQLKVRTLAFLILMLPAVAGAQILPPDFRIPGLVVDEVVVPSETWVDGVPTRTRVGRSKWRADDLFRHYFRLFEDAGFWIPPESSQLKIRGSIQLTALETGSFTSFTVVLTPYKDGTTLVVLGEAELARAKHAQPTDEIPLPPSAKNPVRSSSEGATMVAFESEAKESIILDHYAKELAARGFKATKERNVFQKGPEEMRVTFTREKDGKHHVLVMDTSVTQ